MTFTLRQPAQLILLLITCSLPILSIAAGGGAEKDDGKPKYIEIKPALVSNFVSDKIRFVKADVSLKVKDMQQVERIQSQMPLIKHQLLLMLASQEEETLSTPEGQANLKAQAAETLNALLQEEFDEPTEILEVLFTGFLVE